VTSRYIPAQGGILRHRVSDHHARKDNQEISTKGGGVMVNRSVGRTTHITAQMKFVVPLLIALLTLVGGCFPWPNGDYEFQLGDTVKVVNTGTFGLRVRSTPAGTVTAAVPENWVFQISNVTPESATLDGVTHLWWRVVDAQYESSPTSGWVAEKYLTKIASNSLTPSTVPAYFTASKGQIDSVVAQAQHEVDAGSDWYDYSTGNYLCLFFVRDVYSGQAMGWPSAHAAMVALQGQGAFHYATDSWNPPKGALVFFASTSEYDHVGLCVGSRQVVHVEGDRKAHVRDLGYIVQLTYIETYAGWAYPPEEWCQGVPPTPGLVGWWKFDEGAGGVAYDSSGNGNNGSIHGATYSGGVSGTALEFDGVDDYVDLGNSPSLYGDSMTLMEWIKFTGLPAESGMTINDYSAGYGEWGMSLWVNEYGGVGGTVGAGSNNHVMGAHFSPANDSQKLNDGEWHFVAVTYSNATKTNTLYVDGSFVTANNWAPDGGFTATDNLMHNRSLYKWYIGIHSEYFVYPSIGTQYYRGLIDEVRMYNAALTLEEVTAIYNQTKP
jgi:hypothetical protein